MRSGPHRVAANLPDIWVRPSGPDPHEVVASADGRVAYISNYNQGNGAANTISVVDLVAQKALPPIDLGALSRPHGLTLAGGKLYFHSESSVGKMKRIGNEPRVLVAPCTLRGKPLGPPAEGRARVLGEDEAASAERAIAANYGLFRRIYEAGGSRLPVDMVYVEVTPAPPRPAAPTSAAPMPPAP